MRKTFLFLAAAFLIASTAHSQTQSCPSTPGVYALNGSQWIELAIARADKEKLRTGFPYHGVAIAVYEGSSSKLALSSDVSLCASGVPVGTTFSLGRAKDKKRTREVKVGTYGVFNSTLNFNIDKSQAVTIDQKQQAGVILLRGSELRPGQYILFMQAGSSFRSIPPGFDFYVP